MMRRKVVGGFEGFGVEGCEEVDCAKGWGEMEE